MKVFDTMFQSLDSYVEKQSTLEAEKSGGKKPKLGSGKRFAKLSKKVGSDALAAWIGRKKLGKKKMAKLSAKGRKRAAKK